MRSRLLGACGRSLRSVTLTAVCEHTITVLQSHVAQMTSLEAIFALSHNYIQARFKMNKVKNGVRAFCMLLLVFIPFSVFAGPSYSVFDESYGSGWSSQPWGATVTTTAPPVTFRGTKAAKVVYTTAMGVFKPVASAGFKTTGYKHLIFAVYNYSNADDLWLVAQTTGGTLGTYLRVADYADRGGVPQSMWSWVRIPVSALGLGSSPTLSFFSVASGKANATAYFDDVGFAASSVLYEGINSTNGSLAPGIQRWSWNATIYAPSKNSGNYWFKVVTSVAWGGVQFQHRFGNLSTGDYGAVSIRFQTGDLYMSNQFALTLTDKNGYALGNTVYLNERYVPNTIPFDEGEWYHMTIPMSDFGISSTSLGGVMIQTAVPARFWIDDVRFVQKLARPLLSEWTETSVFGTLWEDEYCGSDVGLPDLTNPKLHTGTDYRAPSGTRVYASSRGFVKQSDAFTDSRWGRYIVLQHESGLATSSLHTDLLAGLKVGDEVQRGQQIGVTSSIARAHLHFGVRLQDVFGTGDYVAHAGSLTKKGCTINGAIYPAFSDRYIDSGWLDGL